MNELKIIIQELQAIRLVQEDLVKAITQLSQAMQTKSPKQSGSMGGSKESIEERDAEFKQLCWDLFKDDLSTNTIKDFYTYWSERSSNSKKMRFEMEKVFDINRRMQTWLKNNNKIMPKSNTGASGFNIGN